MTHEQLRAIALEVAKETNLDIPESFIVDFALRFLAAVAEKAEPMPPGEEVFKFHGYSGPCPKPPLPKPETEVDRLRKVSARHATMTLEKKR